MTKESQTVRNRKTFNNPKMQAIILILIHLIWEIIFSKERRDEKAAELLPTDEASLCCGPLQKAENDATLILGC